MTETENSEYPEDEEDGIDPPLQYEIMNYPADTTLQGYVDMSDRGQLEIPKFQRRYVWDQSGASKLIESFLLGLPVPGVFLFKSREKPAYWVIDGQQRIKTITAFIKGELEDKIFRLKNVSERWNGKKFTELSDDEQFRLKGAVLRSTIIQQISPDDDTSIYLIFERLNTGGLKLHPMEIRQCVSFGPFIEHLKKLNENENWRKIIGKNHPDKRLRDVELILRCLALQNNFSNYDKPMKRFLNDYAEKERKNNSDYEEGEKRFSETCSLIIEQLGEKPFHLKGRLNYGFLDAMVSALLSIGYSQNLKTVSSNLVENTDFLQSITYSTSDVHQVRTRLGLTYVELNK